MKFKKFQTVFANSPKCQESLAHIIDSKTASGNPLLIPSCLEVNGFDIFDQALLMDKVQ